MPNQPNAIFARRRGIRPAQARRIMWEKLPLKSMLWSVLVLLLILWALGFGFHVAGSLIHVLLVALVVLILQLSTGRTIP